MRKILIAAALLVAGCGVQTANADNPHGITGYLDKSSTTPISKQEALKHPERLIKVADSLKVREIGRAHV